MHDKLKARKDLCEIVDATIEDVASNMRRVGKIEPSSADFIDKLTHIDKSLACTIAMLEEKEGGGESQRASYRTVNTTEGARSYRGSMADGMSNRSSMRSYADGGMSGRRDSMGRYSRAADDLMQHLEHAMEASPDEHYRRKIEDLMHEIEG